MHLKHVHVHLYDLKHTLAHEWRAAFAGCDQVDVHQGSIFEADVDAIVSPANSFGFMDGGLDLLLSEHFGWHIEDRVRARLQAEFDGELPIGQAIIVPTDHATIPWLISAPTMRVPMRVDDTANAHLAMRAILRAVRAHNATHPTHLISSLACPGLATGEGRMPPRRCARQMRHAYDVCVHGRMILKGGLAGAVRHHMDLIDAE